VSHSRVGESDIYQEITSRENPRFVLHDSKGFATGEVNNLQTVKRFIDEKAQPIVDIRDKLHAIWCAWESLRHVHIIDVTLFRYCIEIPTENGALFEVADSEFMKMDLQKGALDFYTEVRIRLSTRATLQSPSHRRVH